MSAKLAEYLANACLGLALALFGTGVLVPAFNAEALMANSTKAFGAAVLAFVAGGLFAVLSAKEPKDGGESQS